MQSHHHCPLCGPGATKKILYKANFSEQDLNAEIFSARRLPDGIHGQMVQCQTCEMIFTDPPVDRAVLTKLYQSGLIHYTILEGPIYDSYEPYLKMAMARLKSRKGTFVEIGGGTGFMLRFAGLNGFSNAIEIEPSQDAQKQFSPAAPNHSFVCKIFDKGVLQPNSVSLSCFFQMLDHVPDPTHFLDEVFSSLESGGVAVCITHNTQAVSARLLGEKSPIYDIEHTYLYNPKNLSALFEKCGFKNVEAHRVYNRYPIQYWFNLFPFPKFIKAIFNPILKMTGIGRIRLNIPAGNFAVIGSK